MPTLKHLVLHLQQYQKKHQTLYLVAFMIMFWAVFDGIVSYIAPIVITQRGISDTIMGIIIGSSSIAGALFDFLLCRYLKNLSHRRLLIIMFALCMVYPLILWQATSVYLYLIAMAVWGLYFDLQNVADFEFVGCHTQKEDHSSSFGVLQVFKSLGYLIAPIIAALTIGEFVSSKPFVFAWIFLIISAFFFVVYLRLTRHQPKRINSEFGKANLLHELGMWRVVGKIIFPILLLTLILNIVDSFFWTIGPLIADKSASTRELGGFFMVAYSLPPLLVGWLVGNATNKFGKKKTAFYSFLIGSLFLLFFYFVSNLLLLIGTVFLSSMFLSLAWPSINGAYADYISEAKALEREIEGLEDFFTNLGYIIGPMIAGLLADKVGEERSFFVLGLLGIVISFGLIRVTPKAINLQPQKILEEVKGEA